jgi:hypothetical protein
MPRHRESIIDLDLSVVASERATIVIIGKMLLFLKEALSSPMLKKLVI